VTQFAYDNLDRLVAVTENVVSNGCAEPPCNVVTRYAYDRAGNRTAITDANGHTRSFAYDAADQQISATDALGHVTRWTYDAGGRVRTQQDPRGDVVTPRSTSYDLTFSYAYWPDGQLHTVKQGTDLLASYTYDTAGRLDQVSRANGSVTTYDYDAADHLRDLHTTSGTTDLARFTYTVDRLGLRRAVTETMAMPMEGAASNAASSNLPLEEAQGATGLDAPLDQPATIVTASGGQTFVDDDDIPPASYSTGWTPLTNKQRAVNGTLHLATVKDATVSFTFTGSRISYLYTMGPDRGQTIVTITRNGQSIHRRGWLCGGYRSPRRGNV
jgi:YD repeat-containing protein